MNKRLAKGMLSKNSVIVLIIVCSGMSFLLLSMYSNIQSLQTRISTLENAIQGLEKSVHTLENRGPESSAVKVHGETLVKRDEENVEDNEDDTANTQEKSPHSAISDDDDIVVIYNRVPKTGSTSFAGIAYDLCRKNKFNVLHLNITKNSHVMSWSDQAKFVKNVSTWDSKKPALYHGHVAYIEFARFPVHKRPMFINIIRNPLDRLVSYYYFMRYGDDFRPYLKRRRAGDTETFDACVANNKKECDPLNLWLQVPFMCGQAAECWNPGSKWALYQAKHNLVNNYLAVGLTEQLGEFVALLEATLPRFFKGATKLFNSGSKSHLRKTTNKKAPSEETIAKIQESPIWQIENEFYEFAKAHFNHILSKTFQQTEDGGLIPKRKQFTFEKIRPK